MSHESETNLPDVENNDEKSTEKPKKKVNKLHASIAVFTAVIIILGFLFKSSESTPEVTEKKPSSETSVKDDKALNDSVLNELINDTTNSASKNSADTPVSNIERSSSGEQVQKTGVNEAPYLAVSELRPVLQDVISEELGNTLTETNRSMQTVGELVSALQKQHSKVIQALSAMNKRLKEFEGHTGAKLESVTTQVENIRVGVNKIGGEVEKDNKAFKLIVWGRETYAGDVTVSVSTTDTPKNFESLAVGDSLSGWTVKDIRSDEVDFVNSDGKVWTEGL